MRLHDEPLGRNDRSRTSFRSVSSIKSRFRENCASAGLQDGDEIKCLDEVAVLVPFVFVEVPGVGLRSQLADLCLGGGVRMELKNPPSRIRRQALGEGIQNSVEESCRAHAPILNSNQFQRHPLDIPAAAGQINSMRDLYQQLLVNQFEAALCTLNACVDRCPDAMWNAPVANLAFCQAAFHALFCTDLYLGQNEEDVRRQQFHMAHEQAFRDYEELEDRRQQLLYDRPFIQSYVGHCRDKAHAAVTAETEESLAAASGFPWLKFTRGELYVYNIRHIQHHAAQLSLRLRLDADQQVPWFGSGWRFERTQPPRPAEL